MSSRSIQRLGVLGGGAWGTALAILAAENGLDVRLWARESETVDDINTDHENKTFLPGVVLPERVVAVADPGDALRSDAALLVVPTQYIRTVLADCGAVDAGVPIIVCSKGIEQSSLALPGDVVRDVMPDNPLAVLSGPSFAADVAHGLPTAITLAIADAVVGEQLVGCLGRPTFRIYLSDDLTGAQIGGATKNVLAIACGIVDGRRLGDSARAALMARGFAELQRLAQAMNANPTTLAGLSGLGDLILTCSSRQSRNMSLGVALGEGQSMDDILAARRSVAEGVYTADAVTKLAAKLNVEMPICSAVCDVVQGRRSVDQVIEDLLSRPMSSEA